MDKERVQLPGSYVSAIEIQDLPVWQKIGSRRVPIDFVLEITARCNNNCRHCYVNLSAGDRPARANEITVEEIDRLADEAIELGALWCLITGGEPLLRPDFPEIYMLLKRKGLLVSLFTTATLINEEHIKLFKKYPPRDIEVTVYGVTKETYEGLTRRPGSFKRFMRGLNLLQDNGINVRLKAMAIRSNVHELPQISAFCRERTKDFFRFDTNLHLRIDSDAARNEEIKAERLSPAEVVALERADPERFRALQNECGKITAENWDHQPGNHLFHCGAGNGSFNVAHNNVFQLCSSLVAPGTTYDLRQGNLKDAWFNHVPKVREMQTRRQAFLNSCPKCPLVNMCLWCPAHAHLETGELDRPAIKSFCEMAHIRTDAVLLKTPPA